MINAQLVCKPYLLVAVHEAVLNPSPNIDPDDGEHVILGAVPDTSLPDAVKEAGADGAPPVAWSV
jgi:hypothetical protein